VPVPALEADEPSAALAGDGLAAARAPLGKQLPEAVGTVGLVLPAGKLLASEGRRAVCAQEARPVPGLPAEGDAAGGEHTLALGALRRHLVLKAGNAVDVFVVWNDEGLCTNLKNSIF